MCEVRSTRTYSTLTPVTCPESKPVGSEVLLASFRATLWDVCLGLGTARGLFKKPPLYKDCRMNGIVFWSSGGSATSLEQNFGFDQHKLIKNNKQNQTTKVQTNKTKPFTKATKTNRSASLLNMDP